MKKIVGLLLILVFVTGCSNDYTLKINPNSIEEEINFSIANGDIDKAILINELFRVTNIPYDDDIAMAGYVIDGLRTYDLSPGYNIEGFYNRNIDGDKITLSYIYDEDNYGNSNVFDSCFGEAYFDSNEDYYVINGYDQFKCLIKDKVKVVIKTDYRVIDSNADKVSGDKYIWYFNGDNNLEHDLYIQVSKKYKRKKISYWPFYLMIGLIVGFVIYKFFIRKDRFGFISNNDV